MESKIIGAIGEKEFAIRCLKRGIKVCTPVADNYPYDFIIETEKLLKIQIKTTSGKDNPNKYENAYRFSLCRGSNNKAIYTKKEVDFFALYIIELDMFYIMPSGNKKTLVRVYPFKPDHRLNKYKDGWHLLF